MCCLQVVPVLFCKKNMKIYFYINGLKYFYTSFFIFFLYSCFSQVDISTMCSFLANTFIFELKMATFVN